MQVIQLADVRPRPRRVAVGEFDGVHLGHREVIDHYDTVLTFEPHPARVVHPERAPKLLTTLAVKAELIAEMGVRELVVIPFDEGFAHQSPQEFVDDVLVGRLGATHVSVGDNFRFGFQASGDTDLLAADRRFQTRVVELVGAGGRTISSTRIRQLISDGDVREAAKLLGAPFRVRREVVSGDRRGRKLGFPTANLAPDPELVCPGHGIYACRVGVPVPAGGAGADGAAGRVQEHIAAVSVGVRPTFGEGLAPLIEVHLLDFDGDLYGRELTVEFIERLRGELRFDSVEPLIAQMHADVAATRRLLAPAGPV